MSLLRRIAEAAMAVPFGAVTSNLQSEAASAGGQVKITAVKAMQTTNRSGTLIKIETDAGICGHGPCHAPGPLARSTIDILHHGRLPHLGLIGKDPLAIEVHFHNMFYGYPQRGRHVKVFSGIDIALWDLAGKILHQPVARLLGGAFRDEIPLYSHWGVRDPLSKEAWTEGAQTLKEEPHGFKAFKIDIHHVLGMPMQQVHPTIGPQDERRVNRAYTLAREALGDEIDIIVHCHAELDVPTAIKVAAAVEPIKPLYYEDPLAPEYSASWLALRRTTRLPIMTGENIELPEGALPFLQNQAVDCLQPDLANSGGITGTRRIVALAAMYRIPIHLHNVSGLALNMASQQFTAATFNAPLMECTRDADQAPEAAENAPVIRDGKMVVSTLPGLGIVLDQDYLKATRVEGEPWWG